MIAMLTGTVIEKLEDTLIVDVQGVGYSVYVPTEDYSRLHHNDAVRLYIYEHIREVSYELFGFSELSTKGLFELLLSVNGVGPKVAISILSIGNEAHVKQAISEGNTKYIQDANGVGKRVAERVIVELKDKVGLPSSVSGSSAIFTSSTYNHNDEALLALVALGYDTQDAVVALKDIDDSLSTEQRIRLALSGKQI
ncbi:MAG: Holliday junction branch migration protein RuvA [Candidatus Saccharimonadales bacterium]